MTSSDHDLSDNSETGQHENQSSPPSQVMPHPGTVAPTMPSGILPQLGNGNAMAQTAYPYPDPYYRSIFAPYDTQPYPQCFPAQSMVHLQLMGVQQAGVPLPSDAVEEPVFVNAKQYHGILRRRQSRAKAESEKKLHRNRKPYLHESRHLHAQRRARGCGGRFLTSKKSDENQQKEEELCDKSKPTGNHNSENCDVASENGS
ncbi:nuclear transcription factor Y subunit A-7-like [Ipomoea triloba]|uniref:nuclear transcription factor Y subunit A-7-like n=1 Tax=Ipomoea triloba TaxID=35885 RepID=UPI00125D73D3|nr:nuclear transcription factor Y subunit A-7-like [Ipomoea triloba]